MTWLYSEFTKISTTLILLTQFVVHAEDIVDRFSTVFGLKKIIERRKGERSHTMDISILAKLVELIEELFKAHAPEIVAAAASPEVKAAEEAAAGAAVASVEQDPKVQAGIAAYQSLQNFKAVLSAPTPPTPPAVQ